MKSSHTVFILFSILLFLTSCSSSKDQDSQKTSNRKEETKDSIETKASIIEVSSVSHASFILQFNNKVFYNDPVGSYELYKEFPAPHAIFISDIHGDHLDIDCITSILKEKNSCLKCVDIVVPEAVAQEFPDSLQSYLTVMKNGAVQILGNNEAFKVEAIPMYNLREEALKYHVKGRGNGYLITHYGQRVYISGDTEDIPEMRTLENIDVAFVCMNLPYTMPVENAASAVLDFAPQKVYPYHYRGTEGLSDVDKFKEIVNEGNPDIEVVQLEWYPKQ